MKKTVLGLLALSFAITAACSGTPTAAPSPTSSPAESNSATSTVRLGWEGSAQAGSITASAGSFNTQQDVVIGAGRGQAQSIAHTASAGDFLYISIQNSSEYGTVTCYIDVAGSRVVENTASAAYGIATCSGTL